MLLLDTHVLTWLMEDAPQLGVKAAALADEALGGRELCISPLSFWELAMLRQKKRLAGNYPLVEWQREIKLLGILELPVTSQIALLGGMLEHLHGDPMDRLLVSSAIVHRATLLTADSQILGYKDKRLKRADARR